MKNSQFLLLASIVFSSPHVPGFSALIISAIALAMSMYAKRRGE